MATGTIKNISLAIISLALLGFGVAYYLHASDDLSSIPTDESTWVYCRCQSCKTEFHLNGRELERGLRSGLVGTLEDGKTMAFRCPACKQMKASRIPKPKPIAAPPP